VANTVDQAVEALEALAQRCQRIEAAISAEAGKNRYLREEVRAVISELDQMTKAKSGA
jgi:hypothetical protein